MISFASQKTVITWRNLTPLGIIGLLLFASLACNLTQYIGSGQTAPNQLGTTVALTSTAMFNPAVQINPPTGNLPATEVIPAPVLPSETPTVTPSPTLSIPMVSVTVNTNCRLGPGPEYPNVGALVVGQKVALHGKNERGDWWYIENPQKPGEFCWVWGQYATTEGDTSTLAIVTPPPVTYKLSFVAIVPCGGYTVAQLSVTNNGSLAFESGSVTVLDTEVSGWPPFTPRIDNSLFKDSPCSLNYQSSLPPGASTFITVGQTIGAPLPPSGHNMRGDVRLCTQDEEAGVCVDKSVTFTMP